MSDGLDDSGNTENPAIVDKSIDVVVTVTNVDETPEITDEDAALQFMEIEYDLPAVNEDLEVETYIARDEEGETITWSLVGVDAGDFEIGSSTASCLSPIGLISK